MIHGSPVGFYFSAQGSGPNISVFSAVLFSMLLISGVRKSSTWTFQLHVIVFLRLAPEPTELVIDCLFMTIQEIFLFIPVTGDWPVITLTVAVDSTV